MHSTSRINKEAKGHTTTWTAKLANYKRGKNALRDLYRNIKLPAAPCMHSGDMCTCESMNGVLHECV